MSLVPVLHLPRTENIVGSNAGLSQVDKLGPDQSPCGDCQVSCCVYVHRALTTQLQGHRGQVLVGCRPAQKLFILQGHSHKIVHRALITQLQGHRGQMLVGCRPAHKQFILQGQSHKIVHHLPTQLQGHRGQVLVGCRPAHKQFILQGHSHKIVHPPKLSPSIPSLFSYLTILPTVVLPVKKI
jgi:hypothetical protein